MKLRKIATFFITGFVLIGVFIAGLWIGHRYHWDILCPSKTTPYRLEKNFVSKEGIFFPKGTVISVRECAYMQRFTYQFAIDWSIPLKIYEGETEGRNFSKLYPEDEIKNWVFY